MFNFNQNKLIPKILRHIGDDFRKAGAIAGVGFVGLILPNDSIEFLEAFALIIFGILIWAIGLYFEYIADRIEMRTNKEDV
ncbi:hypothetical protein ACTHGP_06030 [[Pasteurella] aerogenes]